MLAREGGKPLPKIASHRRRSTAERRASSPAATATGRRGVDLIERDGRLSILPASRAACRVELRGTRRRPDRRRPPRLRTRGSLDATTRIADRRRDVQARARARKPPPAPRQVARADRRVRLGPQHRSTSSSGRQAPRADRVVLPLPADGGIGERLRVSRPRAVPRREARLHRDATGTGDEGRGRRASSSSAASRRRGRRRRSASSRCAGRRATQGGAGREAAGGDAASSAQPDLVDSPTLDPTIKLDIRYATDQQLPRHAVLHVGQAFLQRPAAEALVRAHRKLERSRATGC